ncbi:MAG: N-6 DNA methylase [Nannocystaceae bacterium]
MPGSYADTPLGVAVKAHLQAFAGGGLDRGLWRLLRDSSAPPSTIAAEVGAVYERHLASERPSGAARHSARRQREGVFFTPLPVVTRMVEDAVGGWLEALRVTLAVRPDDRAAIVRYRERVAKARVLDPSCGAGVFLASALERLLAEHQTIAAWLERPFDRRATAAEIVARNLEGVDRDPRACELTAVTLSMFGAIPQLRCADFLAPVAPVEPGVDLILGNPPYDVLAARERGEGGAELAALARRVRRDPILARARGGKQNLYELFLCRAATSLAEGGRLAMIVPMAVLGDRQAAGVRALLWDEAPPLVVDCFPQKDRRDARVFRDAKLATCVLQCRRSRARSSSLTLRTHPGGRFSDVAPVVITRQEIARFDPDTGAIPVCTRGDWEIAARLLRDPRLGRLGDVVRFHQGEINETVERGRGTLTETDDGAAILRGANLCRYRVVPASQGRSLTLRVDRFLARARGQRARHHERPRVGLQRSAPMGNYRRLIAAPLEPGVFCFDTVAYVPEAACGLGLDALLGLLNSALLEWWFRLASSNSKANAYQLHNLPLPRFAIDPDGRALLSAGKEDQARARIIDLVAAGASPPAWSLEWIARLSRALVAREQARPLGARRERSRLDPASASLQASLDALIFALYGLGPDDAAQIHERLAARL